MFFFFFVVQEGNRSFSRFADLRRSLKHLLALHLSSVWRRAPLNVIHFSEDRRPKAKKSVPRSPMVMETGPG